jgi:hypothetical protein
MKRVLLLTVLLMTLAIGGSIAEARSTTPAVAQANSASCRGAVGWQKARRMVGRYATIRGRVAGAHYASSSNGSPTFLNLGVDYPSPRRFTVVIWIDNRAKFRAPERRYRGRTICVRGYVETYAGVPQIEASSPTQITVVS